MTGFLEHYSFPSDTADSAVVAELDLKQPLETITFKAPQLLAYYFGLYHPRFILSFDKGMGKTITYLASLYADRPNKMVILCSENAKLAQRREIIRHLQDWKLSYVFVEGQKADRAKKWKEDKVVFICTYATLQADMGLRDKSRGRVAPSWVDQPSTYMAMDEWHKVLRNKSSGTFKMLKGFKNERIIFSSGSASGKGAQDLWPVLHLCNPIKFSSYWLYVNRYCYIEETYFGKKIGGVKNIHTWRQAVSPYIFHRRKDTKDYPPKTRQALEVRMESWQKRVHDQLRKECFAILPDGEFFASPNVLAATHKLRQFLICPKVLDKTFGWGAGLEGIWADASDSELTHFVISTPYKEPIEWIERFFQEKGLHTERLTGGEGINTDELEARIARWTKKGGVIIQTIQFAESYELPAAQNMYMLGYLHNPEQNSQAEDRIHRDIRVTPHPVNIYYVKNLGSYDENVVEAMSESADIVHAMMHSPIKGIFHANN